MTSLIRRSHKTCVSIFLWIPTLHRVACDRECNLSFRTLLGIKFHSIAIRGGSNVLPRMHAIKLSLARTLSGRAYQSSGTEASSV